MPMKRSVAALTLTLLLASSIRPAASQTIGDPDTYEKSLQVALEAIEEMGPYDNPEQAARVNRIGYELAQHSQFQKYPFTFTLVAMPVPNAVSLPGGQIFVTKGLLDLGLDDDMLASVLGHEMGHVIHEHSLHLQRKATLMNVLGNLLVAGVLIGAERNSKAPALQAPYDPRYGYNPGNNAGNLVQGAAAASLIVSELLLRSYSRQNEDESDVEGLRLSAAAGYDPDGERRMFELWVHRAPETREYGYLQTHPFMDDRARAAEARRGEFKIQSRSSADAYRQRTQAVLMQYLKTMKIKEPPARSRPMETPAEAALRYAKPTAREFLKESALAVWPRGATADSLRLEKLHRLRDAERSKNSELRDYGAVLHAYRKTAAEVRGLDPKSELLATLDADIADQEAKRKAGYPAAAAVVKGGIYETAFLTAFLSNYPDAREAPQVALALGDAYSRIGKEADAVSQYLACWKAAPESAEGKRARSGLRLLAPSLKELAALQQLADQDQDADLRRLAGERLVVIAKSYDDLANGAEYLRRFPEGEQVVAVLDRLNVLADNLYSEVVLYQGFGDSAKAIDRINKILTNAPLSPAAEKLRDHALIDKTS